MLPFEIRGAVTCQARRRTVVNYSRNGIRSRMKARKLSIEVFPEKSNTFLVSQRQDVFADLSRPATVWVARTRLRGPAIRERDAMSVRVYSDWLRHKEFCSPDRLPVFAAVATAQGFVGAQICFHFRRA